MATNKDDVCCCEECKHQKATECLVTFLCTCCERADRIRFEHPVFDDEEGLSAEEKARREEDTQDQEKKEAMEQAKSKILN